MKIYYRDELLNTVSIFRGLTQHFSKYAKIAVVKVLQRTGTLYCLSLSETVLFHVYA